MFETTNIQVMEGRMRPAGQDIDLPCFSLGASSGLMVDNSVLS